MSLVELSAAQQRDGLDGGEFTARELTQAHLERIDRHDGSIGAFLQVHRDAALAAADESDRRRAAGLPLGPLDGIPIAVKDVLCAEGERTTCSSRMLEHFRPPYDATVVASLKRAGAILIGRTNMDEFAMGGSTENAGLGVTCNPWAQDRVPGGSSGGSAAAVAARMVPLAIGTDTGGSIRQPAAFCGIAGLKPTYGRVSRFGLIAFASSLDQVGPMARSVEDVALLLQAIAGPDRRDATCAARQVPAYTEAIRQPCGGLTLGVVRDHFGAGLDSEVETAVGQAIATFRALGAEVRDISLPHGKYAIATYYLIASCEASSNLARYDGVHFGYRTDEPSLMKELAEQRGRATGQDDDETALVRMYRRSRAEGFGAEVKRRIMLGTYALSAGYYDAYYLKAMKVRRLIHDDFVAAFRDVELIVGPTSPTPAFRLGEKIKDPLAMYLGDLYTVSANLAGIPGLSIPCGFTGRGLPIGLQLQAPAFAESRLLQVAHLFQQHTDWHTRSPGLS